MSQITPTTTAAALAGEQTFNTVQAVKTGDGPTDLILLCIAAFQALPGVSQTQGIEVFRYLAARMQSGLDNTMAAQQNEIQKLINDLQMERAKSIQGMPYGGQINQPQTYPYPWSTYSSQNDALNAGLSPADYAKAQALVNDLNRQAQALPGALGHTSGNSSGSSSASLGSLFSAEAAAEAAAKRR